MRRSDIPIVALYLRRAGELAAMYGEDTWDSTKRMGPGPRAAHFDPDGRGGWRHEAVPEGDRTIVAPIPNDPTGEAAVTDDSTASVHQAFQDQHEVAQREARKLIDMYEQLRYDRADPRANGIPVEDPATDQEYCSHHLSTLGTCEPRYRGDLCRACYDFNLAHDLLPTRHLLRLRHEGKQWTEQQVTEALTELRRGRKKRKARR